jgi:AcrR family transcriptional regulator
MSDSTGEDLDTRERMMFATLTVLQEHGYGGLSIKRIADEAGLSKSSFYHFFDDKDDLLLSFLDFMLGQYGLPFDEADADGPADALDQYLDFALHGVTGDLEFPLDGFDPGSGRPYVELRAQAAHDDDYRERFTAIDGTVHDRLADTIQAGIDAGIFRDVDVHATAELLTTIMLGGLFRRATSDRADVDAVRAELDHLLEAHLYADD